jgi:hypothetical protein
VAALVPRNGGTNQEPPRFLVPDGSE